MRTLKNNMQIKPWGISHSVSAQLSGGEKSKSNSYNKEQTNKIKNRQIKAKQRKTETGNKFVKQ